MLGGRVPSHLIFKYFGGQMNHKLLNKTLKTANRELRAELKRLQIELDCIKLVVKKQVSETEK